MCVVFKTVPSRLNTFFWKYTKVDVQCEIKLQLGLKTIEMTQQYENMLKVAGAIFGESEDDKPKPPKDEAEAMAQFAALGL